MRRRRRNRLFDSPGDREAISLARRAVREGWAVPPQVRAAVVDRLVHLVIHARPVSLSIAAARVLIEMDRSNPPKR